MGAVIGAVLLVLAVFVLIALGSSVRVESVDGLTLLVSPSATGSDQGES